MKLLFKHEFDVCGRTVSACSVGWCKIKKLTQFWLEWPDYFRTYSISVDKKTIRESVRCKRPSTKKVMGVGKQTPKFLCADSQRMARKNKHSRLPASNVV